MGPTIATKNSGLYRFLYVPYQGRSYLICPPAIVATQIRDHIYGRQSLLPPNHHGSFLAFLLLFSREKTSALSPLVDLRRTTTNNRESERCRARPQCPDWSILQLVFFLLVENPWSALLLVITREKNLTRKIDKQTRKLRARNVRDFIPAVF